MLAIHPLVGEFCNSPQCAWNNRGPLQRCAVSPQGAPASRGCLPVEMKLRSGLLEAMPPSVRTPCLLSRQVSAAELLFAAMVEAGPGGRRDREALQASVVQHGTGAPTAGIWGDFSA